MPFPVIEPESILIIISFSDPNGSRGGDGKRCVVPDQGVGREVVGGQVRLVARPGEVSDRQDVRRQSVGGGTHGPFSHDKVRWEEIKIRLGRFLSDIQI